MQSKRTQHTSHQPPQFSVGWSSSGTAQHLADKSSEPQQHCACSVSVRSRNWLKATRKSLHSSAQSAADSTPFEACRASSGKRDTRAGHTHVRTNYACLPS